MAGLGKDGWITKQLHEARDDLVEKFRNEFGDGIQTNPRSRIGTIIGIVAGLEVQLWELGQDIYWSFDRTKAEGRALDNLGEAVGVERLEKLRSKVTLELSGDAGTTIQQGSTVSHDAKGTLWDTTEDVTLDSNGDGTVQAKSQEYGTIEAVAGTLTNIETNVTGWNSVTNPEDATLGRERESDSDYRQRIATSLQTAGSATAEAIRGELEEIDGVVDAIVVENLQDIVDNDGRQPHSFEAIVQGGANQDIADEIWDQKPAGIGTDATATGSNAVTVTITDQNGKDQDVDFTRPIEIDMYLDATIIIESGAPFTLTSERKTAIEDAMLDEGANYSAGTDVRDWRFENAISQLDFIKENTEWIESIEVKLEDADPPSLETFEVDLIKRAVFDSTRTEVFEASP